MTKKRIPVSITTTSALDNGDIIFVTNVIANDGTMWEYREGDEWIQLPDLPQDDEELGDLDKDFSVPFCGSYKVTTPACDKVGCSVKDKQNCSKCNDPLLQLVESIFGKSPFDDVVKRNF